MQYKYLVHLSSDDITPLVLWLRASTDGENTQWKKGWFSLVSFIARRRICGQDTTGSAFRNILEGVFRSVQADVRNASDAGDRIVANLKNLVVIGTSAWPDDAMLRKSFANKDIYNDPGPVVTRDILRMLEMGKRIEEKSERGMEIPDGVDSIEHIMPRAWRNHWRTSIDEAVQDGERRDSLVHTIGNLTLVTSDLNRRLGNNEWKDKQRMISEDSMSSELLMNQEMRLQHTGKWDVEEIVKRSNDLFEIACGIWPGPNHTLWN